MFFIQVTGRPEKMTLKDSFFGGAGCLEVEAKMIYDGKQGVIINQFVRFTKVFDEQRKKFPDDPGMAVEETIKICKDEDVLREYLEREEAAVVKLAFADKEMATRLTKEARGGRRRSRLGRRRYSRLYQQEKEAAVKGKYVHSHPSTLFMWKVKSPVPMPVKQYHPYPGERACSSHPRRGGHFTQL